MYQDLCESYAWLGGIWIYRQRCNLVPLVPVRKDRLQDYAPSWTLAMILSDMMTAAGMGTPVMMDVGAQLAPVAQLPHWAVPQTSPP